MLIYIFRANKLVSNYQLQKIIFLIDDRITSPSSPHASTETEVRRFRDEHKKNEKYNQKTPRNPPPARKRTGLVTPSNFRETRAYLYLVNGSTISIYPGEDMYPDTVVGEVGYWHEAPEGCDPS